MSGPGPGQGRYDTGPKGDDDDDRGNGMMSGGMMPGLYLNVRSKPRQ